MSMYMQFQIPYVVKEGLFDGECINRQGQSILMTNKDTVIINIDEIVRRTLLKCASKGTA